VRRRNANPQPARARNLIRTSAGDGHIESAHAQAFAENQARTEKSDSRYDLCGNPGLARSIRDQRFEHNERRRTERDERIGVQARKAIAPPSLKANHGAQEHDPD